MPNIYSFSTCLRLLKGRHESGRSHVTLFLTFGFHYQTIIEEFDKQCGLPIFFKVVSLNFCSFTFCVGKRSRNKSRIR